MKATLSNYRQSPRKVRLVANAIRGKSVAHARTTLKFLEQKSSPALLKLLNSAVSNAQNAGASAEDLVVQSIQVNKGAVMRRFMPKARGRAARYAKTLSIVTLELSTKQVTGNKEQVTVHAKKAPKKRASKKLTPTT